MLSPTPIPFFLTVFSSSLVFFFFFFLLPIISQIQASNIGHFVVDLIHHDSPISPFYNASQAPFDRSLAALDRSNSRANLLSILATSSIQSDVVLQGSEYLMALSLGAHPIRILATVDTVSSLIWTDCTPLSDKHTLPPPPFSRPPSSFRYHILKCGSEACSRLHKVSCGTQKECKFEYVYDNRSYSDAVLASETLIFDSRDEAEPSVAVQDSAIGCVQESAGLFDKHRTGIVGLGAGPLSLISKLGHSVEWTFSYCLVPLANTKSKSFLRFGRTPPVAAVGATPLSSPLVVSSESFYSLTLEGVSLGNKHLDVWPEEGKGKILIDPGTLFTYLPEKFLTALVGELADIMETMSNEPAGVSWGKYNMCYMNNEESRFSSVDITFRFAGANVTLGGNQTFMRVAEDVVCFGFLPSGDPSVAIFGSLAQQDFRIEYDLHGKKLSFAPTECSNIFTA